jgi:hypothetical protein
MSVAFRPAFVVLAALAAPIAWAGPSNNSPAPDFAQTGLPSRAEAQAIIRRFRDAGFAEGGSCYLEFELRELPRRGDERIVHGRLWAGSNDRGPVVRLALDDQAAGESRLLIQGGPKPAIWRPDAAGSPQAVDLFAPLAPGSNITAFDLQMPFLYWPDASVVSVNRVLGRPAHEFVFRPPADFAAAHPEISAVRADIDTEYNAPVRTQLIGRDGRVLKTLSLVGIKKVSDQWVLKTVDVRNEATRDKTRFSVTAAALGLDLSPSLFDPAQLGGSIGPPSHIVRFGD